MQSSKGLSFPLVLAIGFILSSVLVSAVILVHFINLNFKPSVKNIEHQIQQGRLDRASAFVSQIESDSSKISMLKAEVLFLKALKKRKDEKWKNYGTEESDWFRSEELDSAIVELKSIIESENEKKYPQAHYYMGQIYFEKGWFYEAEDQFLKVLEIDPNNRDTKLSLSCLYTKTSRFSEAQRLLRSGFQQHPEDPEIAKNMAYLYRYYIDLPESATVWFNRYLNNARQRDLDVNHAKNELEDLLLRYPEYSPTEPQDWRNKAKNFNTRQN
ncbi:MAG TPA: tetratricopeptide repeat protein [Chitinispirillaceae bacterium]|nr:tetratricopeptide repeat protein [Chitinispirillaceae bacterium]